MSWAEIEGTVHGRFERMASQYPGEIAIDAADACYTYSELDGMANRLASALRNRMPGADQRPVAILLPHGAAPVASLLGILKAGHIYLALDPADPLLRIRQILEHAGAGIVLCNGATAETAAAAAAGLASAMRIEEFADPAAQGTDEPGAVVAADAPASLYYTSGSTGAPKGVLYTHRARMVTALRNSNGIRISPRDRLALLYPARYAGAANNTFGALLNGACLLPFDYASGGAAALARWLAAKRITIYHSVPPMFRQMAALAAEDGPRFEEMRLVMLSSDSVYPADLALFAQVFPRGCLFANSWGLSESPLFRPCFFDHDSRPEGGLAAIGCPIEDAMEEDEVLLLGEDGAEVPTGEAGEIAVRSRYFAAGYWRDPKQTSARFQADKASPAHKRYSTGDLGRRHADGTVVHLGRKDFQVQVGGERVEIAEIEAALSGHPALGAAVVVAHENASGEQRLVAYVECPDEPPPLEGELRSYVAERLPRQMVPDRFVFCRRLELTAAGKVNRRALPPPPRERPRLRTPFEAPATALESEVAAIFGDVLELDGIGARDSFFELGGKSLGAMRVLSRIRERYGARIPMAGFVQGAAPVQVAAAIEHSLGGDTDWEKLLAEIEEERHSQ